MILQMEPNFDWKESLALMEYMNSGGWVTEFKKTREFENMIADYVGSKYCSVICNGTMSLVAALLACEIKSGDEVIVPDYTMVATPNAVELIGAKAVFVDIDRNNLCMDFELMQKAVTEKTRAVILVTINGRYPKNIYDFVDYCRDNNLWLVEDAAQSLGSCYEGKHLGTFGDIGSFSFSAPKIITTGQGGALVTNNEELYNRIKRIRDFGRDTPGKDHYITKGWNFKFTDIQAVIGIEQMKKLEKRVLQKKKIGELYKSMLKDIPGIEFIKTNYNETAPWFFDILVEERDKLKEYLKTKNIETREFYPALHSEPAYNIEGNFPVTEDISRKGLWLPSSIKLSVKNIEYICESIKGFYK